MDRYVDVAIVGAGTAGLAALSQVRQAKRSFVLINGGELGTTCARVGCMPSKAAIQVAEDFHRRYRFERIGIVGTESLQIDAAEALEHVRDLRDIFVDRVLAGTTDDMGDEFIEGYAEFVEPNVLQVDGHTVHAKKIVIATGSRPLIPPAWEKFKDRILTTDNLFEQQGLPPSIAVIGLGVIGLELGQTLKRLGVDVTGIDQLESIGGLQDPVVNQLAIDIIGQELPLWLGHPADVEEEDRKLRVRAGEQSVLVDKLLASLGRPPILESLHMERLGCKLDANGVPEFDPHTMQIGDLPVFIAGDTTGARAILHEAADEGRIAGYNAARDEVVAFQRRTPLAITFCDPNIAITGTSWAELDHEATAVGEIRFGPVGRALIMGKNKGILRVYADKATGKILGAAMVAPRGENLAHLLAWSIHQALTAADLLKMPYYHPAIEEALQAALQDLVRKIDAPPPEPLDLERLQKT
jgi:dihydrolipoamide dehydrogenase